MNLDEEKSDAQTSTAPVWMYSRRWKMAHRVAPVAGPGLKRSAACGATVMIVGALRDIGDSQLCQRCLASRPGRAEDAVRAVAPVPGVEIAAGDLARGAHLYAPHIKLSTFRSAITDCVSHDRWAIKRHEPGRWLVASRYGFYTTRDVESVTTILRRAEGSS